ncbi:MAG: hypothetical protein JOZ15_04805 [Acidobacteria bacterium]|nr:hypothetical protein [Acidobacteriota bacterium]
MPNLRSMPGALALALPLLLAMPLAAQTFAAGDDGWATPAGGQTQVDLGSMPAATSALGSPIVGGNVINLQGQPLDSANLGSIDTILSRGAIASGQGTLTIVALNLVSSSNVQLQDGRAYSLAVCLSDTASSSGSITLTQVNGDGGTFSSSFTVLPKLVFTNVNNSSDVLTIDCGSGGCDPLTMTASNAGWVQTGGPSNFSPSAEGITPLPNGNDTVANCGGTHTLSLVPAGGFYPGWSAGSGGSGTRVAAGSGRGPLATPFSASGGGISPSPVPHAHSSFANHVVKPPQDCRQAQRFSANGRSAAPQLVARYCLASVTPIN